MNSGSEKRVFSSGGIIVKRQDGGLKVLLIKDMYGRWTWPKGHVEAGETIEETAKREIREEVGLKDIRLLRKIADIRYFFKLGGSLMPKTVHLFLFEALGDEPVKALESEVKSAKWFSSGEALKKIDYSGAKQILKKALAAASA